jgi:thiol:disulfide interchange protein
MSIPKNPSQMSELMKNTKCLVLKFSAKWCGPCKNKNFLEAYSNLKKSHESNKNVMFLELDVDLQENLITETELYNFNVSAVPTLLVYSYGNLMNEYTGTNCLNSVDMDINRVVAYM